MTTRAALEKAREAAHLIKNKVCGEALANDWPSGPYSVTKNRMYIADQADAILAAIEAALEEKSNEE